MLETNNLVSPANIDDVEYMTVRGTALEEHMDNLSVIVQGENKGL